MSMKLLKFCEPVALLHKVLRVGFKVFSEIIAGEQIAPSLKGNCQEYCSRQDMK